MGFYVVCDDDSRHESMTKEQILAAITQAIETGSIGNCDTGFITKIKEQNCGGCITFWVGTQAQYNAIAEKANNCIYIITDDTVTEDTKAAFEKAAKAAEDAASAATKAVTTARPIDITDELTFTLTENGSVTKFSASRISKRVVYSPATNMVFFTCYCIMKGSASAGAHLYVQLGGKYLPSVKQDGHESYNVISSTPKLSVSVGPTPEMQIVVNENIDDFEDMDITLTGWYYCDGEGK